jgi:hypothetical protein
MNDSDYDVESYITSTDAQPTGISPSSAGPSKSWDGATIVHFYCNFDVAANVIWYCRPGSTCTTRFYFLFHAAIARTGGCSIVNRYSCQVYARADPPYYDLVNYATVTQSQPGAPVVGDKWCG